MSAAIGLEIKLLRERLKLSAKDLSERIGLSPSQMSRLESGQRRVDAVLLSKIARALGVHPSYFFDAAASDPNRAAPLADPAPEEAAEAAALPEPGEPTGQLGRLIKAKRHERHLTPEELGQRIGKGRTFVLDLEAGQGIEFVTGEALGKIARALKLEPEQLLDAQRAEIRDLKRSLARLERAHTDRTLGELTLGGEATSDGAGTTRRGVPLVAGEDGGLPARFDGRSPLDRVVDYLYVPGLRIGSGFAVSWQGEEMQAPGGPSFRSGDLLVFSSDREPRHRDFVLAVLGGEPGPRSLFRQLFLDPKGKVRLQPLNLDDPPLILERDEVRELFLLVARLTTV